MLDFTLDENTLMLELLELSPNRLGFLQNQQQSAYDALGSAFLDRVRTILEEYTVLDESDALASSEEKSGLKKADSLEWFTPSDSRNQISLDRLYRIKNKLATILNISLNSISSSNSGTGFINTPIYKG